MTSGCASLKALLRSRKPPGFSSADNGALHVMLANVLELEGADHVAWQQRFAVSGLLVGSDRKPAHGNTHIIYSIHLAS